jgi:NADH dehydrogenase
MVSRRRLSRGEIQQISACDALPSAEAAARCFLLKPPPDSSLPHIVVVGAGFAGLRFVQHFPANLARVTVIDRQNHHLFQPLLYQVATAGLSAVDIAQPIRALFGDRPNFAVVMGDVEAIDLAGKRVHHSRGDVTYDHLVLAAGGVTSYFGHPEWEEFAPGLKSLDDALRIRRKILCAFERAETESDPEMRKAATTIVVVGGGPTGVELAGAFADLTRTVLHKDFDRIDPSKSRVMLIEGSDHLLSPFPPELQESAKRQLERLGVEIRLNKRVEVVRDGELVAGGETIRADNIIWGAGVGGAPIARKLNVELDRAGRIKVLPDCSVPGYP